MGLAPIQARLLMLTSRQNDIEGNLMGISNQKLALSRRSSIASEKYNDAMSARKLVWTSFNGNTRPLTYNMLMPNPRIDNDAAQYMITDSRGRVMLNDKYADMMKNSDGSNVNQTQFLEHAMGIDESKANKYIIAVANSRTTGTVEEAQDTIPTLTAHLNTAMTDATSDSAFSKPKATGIGLAAYNEVKQELTAALANVKSIQKTIGTGTTGAFNISYKNPVTGYTPPPPPSTMTDQQKDFVALHQNITYALAQLERVHNPTSDTTSNWEHVAILKSVLTGASLASSIPDQYLWGNPNKEPDADGKDKHTNSEFYAADDAAKNLHTNAYKATAITRHDDTYNWSIKDLSNVINGITIDAPDTTIDPNTLPRMSEAKYYLNLYGAIEKQGFVRNPKMDAKNDTDGKILQNDLLMGNAFIYKYKGNGNWGITSTSDVGSPMRNVSDEEKIAKAEAEYKSEKDQVNYKETRLDMQMNNLDTERAAITNEMESVHSLIKENLKKFKMFDA